MAKLSRKQRMVAAILAIVCLPVLAIAIGGLLFFARYVDTEYDVDEERAARAFAAERARVAGGQVPLIEYRGFDEPLVRRAPTAPRQQLRAVHALGYSAEDGELTRAVVPASVLRMITLGGRIGLMGSGLFDDGNTRISLEDLERHGPGLVLDISGASVGLLTTSDVVLGTRSRNSRLLVWTE